MSRRAIVLRIGESGRTSGSSSVDGARARSGVAGATPGERAPAPATRDRLEVRGNDAPSGSACPARPGGRCPSRGRSCARRGRPGRVRPRPSRRRRRGSPGVRRALERVARPAGGAARAARASPRASVRSPAATLGGSAARRGRRRRSPAAAARRRGGGRCGCRRGACLRGEAPRRPRPASRRSPRAARASPATPAGPGSSAASPCRRRETPSSPCRSRPRPADRRPRPRRLPSCATPTARPPPSWATASASRGSSPSAHALPARHEALHRRHDAIGLRHARLLELRAVRHRHVERRHAQDGRVERVEREALHAVGDLGADAAVRPALVHHDHRCVRSTLATSVSSSSGRRLRRSTTSAEMPSFSSAAAASSATCVMREYATSVTSVPGRDDVRLAERDHVLAVGHLALHARRASRTP